jgi:hypothetical protein
VTRDPGHIVGVPIRHDRPSVSTATEAIAGGALVDDDGVLTPGKIGVASSRRAAASAEVVGRSHSSDLLRMQRTVD